mmetsp:Transcript_18642/g.43112  ORF Transcript_18642/g.43112 Transcript_18642/m.43112 type:complete len:481 (+) Transcript_18642:109-1551(+)|eukprot:CAMPEP_0197180740 /NCGR_PEP_ID=MMETSP1423-20130617/5244_1 /TAXON_ID=476441 /ORGANISM="Pseudo-nitzschia heimii, Strain UNC1101" /LENGTH=480 /DNA_ID=CAMNT_0042630859 /DNA_START=63 /DNA_END=1505 /DNA_ORIENTATION=+
MNSKPTKTDTNIEKQPFSSKATLDIYIDQIIDEKEDKEPSHRIHKPMNSNVLANASNKYETQQQEKKQQGQQQTKKKKKWYNKKKYKNKNYDSFYNDEDHTHRHDRSNQYQDQYRHHHQQQRNNQGEYFRYNGNQNYSAQFEVPHFVPGNRGTVPVYLPQQPKYPHASDMTTNVLVDRRSHVDNFNQDHRDYSFNTNYGDEKNISFVAPKRSNSSPQSWMDEISDNSQIKCVFVTNGGKYKAVPIPEDVGASVLKELLLHKENAEISSWYHDSDYGNKSASSHPDVRPYPVLRSNENPDHQVQYGNYPSVSNPPQFFNGFGTLPPPCESYGIPMPPPMINPMIQQPMSPYQYVGTPSIVPNAQPSGWVFPGYTYPNEQRISSVPDEEIKGGQCIEKAGFTHRNRSNNRPSGTETTPTRADNHEDAGEDDVDNPKGEDQNHDAVTPHRGVIVGNGEDTSRRVSISPMGALVNTPVTITGDG